MPDNLEHSQVTCHEKIILQLATVYRITPQESIERQLPPRTPRYQIMQHLFELVHSFCRKVALQKTTTQIVSGLRWPNWCACTEVLRKGQTLRCIVLYPGWLSRITTMTLSPIPWKGGHLNQQSQHHLYKYIYTHIYIYIYLFIYLHKSCWLCWFR